MTLTPASFSASRLIKGSAPDSTWARGLAWSLYGFGTVFTYTGRDSDLASPAQRRLLHRPVPGGPGSPWDFDVPPAPTASTTARPPRSPRRACGTSRRSSNSREPSRAQRYRDAALTILDSLCTDRYLAWTTPGWEGVLKHGVYHFHKKLGVDESVMWGDFFFLEAMDKVLQAAPAELELPMARAGTSSISVPGPMACYTMAPARTRKTGWASQAQAARILTMSPDQPSEHEELGEELQPSTTALSAFICRSSSRKAIGVLDADAESDETEIEDEALPRVD